MSAHPDKKQRVRFIVEGIDQRGGRLPADVLLNVDRNLLIDVLRDYVAAPGGDNPLHCKHDWVSVNGQQEPARWQCSKCGVHCTPSTERGILDDMPTDAVIRAICEYRGMDYGDKGDRADASGLWHAIQAAASNAIEQPPGVAEICRMQDEARTAYAEGYSEGVAKARAEGWYRDTVADEPNLLEELRSPFNACCFKDRCIAWIETLERENLNLQHDVERGMANHNADLNATLSHVGASETDARLAYIEKRAEDLPAPTRGELAAFMDGFRAARSSIGDDAINALRGLSKAVKQLSDHFDKPVTDDNATLWLALNSAQAHAEKVLSAAPSSTRRSDAPPGYIVRQARCEDRCRMTDEGQPPCKGNECKRADAPPSLWGKVKFNHTAESMERVSASFSAVGWVVAVEEEGRMRVYGPQYRTQEAAEYDADLPRKRGQRAEVWACYPTSKAPHVERGEAVNLARWAVEHEHPQTAITKGGVKLLADAVLRMDAALSATGAKS